MSITATRSKVVIHDSQSEPVVGVAVQLLGVLGHDVCLADTPEQAIAAAQDGRADLLVLTVTEPAEQAAYLDQLALLPHRQRPGQVAILSDADVETAPRMLPSAPDMKVHIFVKPVHALGLLNVIKRLAQAN